MLSPIYGSFRGIKVSIILPMKLDRNEIRTDACAEEIYRTKCYLFDLGFLNRKKTFFFVLILL